MDIWQAERLARQHQSELRSDGVAPGAVGIPSRSTASHRRQQPSRDRGPRPSLRYRVGTLLLAIGERLTLADSCEAGPRAHPRVP